MSKKEKVHIKSGVGGGGGGGVRSEGGRGLVGSKVGGSG